MDRPLRWHKLHASHGTGVPTLLRDWLSERRSLTRRLRRWCHGCLSVDLIQQGLTRPRHDEAIELGAPPEQLALTREVYLLCAGEICIYARTVIPISTLSGALVRLKYLGTRPLGDLLFADPAVTRRTIEITRVPQDSSLFQRATQDRSCHDNDELWGRRSVFHLQRRPLLVSEFFLPGIFEHGQPHL